jgi:hypothetical protein
MRQAHSTADFIQHTTCIGIYERIVSRCCRRSSASPETSPEGWEGSAGNCDGNWERAIRACAQTDRRNGGAGGEDRSRSAQRLRLDSEVSGEALLFVLLTIDN